MSEYLSKNKYELVEYFLFGDGRIDKVKVNETIRKVILSLSKDLRKKLTIFFLHVARIIN